MKPKSNMHKGFEVLLNDPNLNAFQNPSAVKSLLSASGMSTGDVLKHLGKTKKAPKKQEEDRSKQRIEKLETETEEK